MPYQRTPGPLARTVAVGAMLACQALGAGAATAAETASGTKVCTDTVWPNNSSAANSDPWLAQNHACLVRMEPRVLVINFANGLGLDGNDNIAGGPLTQAQVARKANDFLSQLSQASRYQPALNAKARPFLQPKVVKVVNLQDTSGHANSAYFPRGVRDPVTMEPLVGYSKLFSAEYAPYWGFKEKGRYLTLGEALNRGLYHDIIMVANQVDGGRSNPVDQVTRNILEVAFVANAYDGNFAPLSGEFVKNGTPYERQKADMSQPTLADHNSMPWTGRSLRIYFMNASRGNGCLMHSLGHEVEFRYNESRLYAPGKPWDGASPNPYMQPLFRAYADFDMRSKYGVDFDSLYAGSSADQYAYFNNNTLGASTGITYVRAGVQQSITNYRPVAGNVHYPPGATHGYDYDHANTVMSSMESFRKPNEAPVPFNKGKWDYLSNDPTINNDCGGAYLTYWFQNMPGLDNPARDLTQRPMRNWWPFLYY